MTSPAIVRGPCIAIVVEATTIRRAIALSIRATIDTARSARGRKSIAHRSSVKWCPSLIHVSIGMWRTAGMLIAMGVITVMVCASCTIRSASRHRKRSSSTGDGSRSTSSILGKVESRVRESRERRVRVHHSRIGQGVRWSATVSRVERICWTILACWACGCGRCWRKQGSLMMMLRVQS